ncbi:MAG TPA: hypothetical protein VKU19_41125 [Bryobacteraceae bacterium]|nr:hypothetical protein [Bryobacteraceae bacterium]
MTPQSAHRNDAQHAGKRFEFLYAIWSGRYKDRIGECGDRTYNVKPASRKFDFQTLLAEFNLALESLGFDRS